MVAVACLHLGCSQPESAPPEANESDEAEIDGSKLVLLGRPPRAHVSPPFTGTALWKYKNGKRRIARTFVNGIRQGPMVVWFDDGTTQAYTVNYKNDRTVRQLGFIRMEKSGLRDFTNWAGTLKLGHRGTPTEPSRSNTSGYKDARWLPTPGTPGANQFPRPSRASGVHCANPTADPQSKAKTERPKARRWDLNQSPSRSQNPKPRKRNKFQHEQYLAMVDGNCWKRVTAGFL